jgi:hypothetical protein
MILQVWFASLAAAGLTHDFYVELGLHGKDAIAISAELVENG